LNFGFAEVPKPFDIKPVERMAALAAEQGRGAPDSTPA
jgi:hypothetical protein